MKKQTAYIFAAFVLVLLIIAGITAWALGFFDSGERPPEATEPVTESEMPVEQPTAAPTATPRPTATPTPAPTATPTPAPEPSSAPSGKVIASGAFDSATGCGINTRTQWTAAENGGSSVLLTLKVYVRSYSVSIGARGYTVTSPQERAHSSPSPSIGNTTVSTAASPSTSSTPIPRYPFHVKAGGSSPEGQFGGGCRRGEQNFTIESGCGLGYNSKINQLCSDTAGKRKIQHERINRKKKPSDRP